MFHNVYILFFILGAAVVAAFVFRMVNMVRHHQKYVIQLKAQGFNIDEQRISGDYMLCVDYAKQLWALKDEKDSDPQILRFDELVDYEIFENRSFVTRGITGGVIPETALITEDQNAAETMYKVNQFFQIDLKVVVKDSVKPERLLTFTNTEGEKSYTGYFTAVQACRDMASILNRILVEGTASLR